MSTLHRKVKSNAILQATLRIVLRYTHAHVRRLEKTVSDWYLLFIWDSYRMSISKSLTFYERKYLTLIKFRQLILTGGILNLSSSVDSRIPNLRDAIRTARKPRNGNCMYWRIYLLDMRISVQKLC